MDRWEASPFPEPLQLMPRSCEVSEFDRFGREEARKIGDALRIDWSRYDLEQFRMGLGVELEHGAHDPETNVTGDDPIQTGKIAWAHLKELPDYYTRLRQMEEGEAPLSAAGAHHDDEFERFTLEEARSIGAAVGIDFGQYDLEQFRMGLGVELEHGSHDPETNVTNNDPILTGKIAWAHLKELPDYYTRLRAMEGH